MSDLDGQADPAGQDEVIAEQAVETVEAEAPEGEQAEAAEGAEPEKQRETAKERRERDKQLKARLRQEAAEAAAEANRARQRHQQIVDAGKSEAAPVEKDFTDLVDFAAAKAVWQAEQKRIGREAGQVQSEMVAAEQRAAALTQQETALAQKAWLAQINEGKQRYADFEAVALDASVPVPEHVALMVMGSDLAADVAYHLGKNPTEALAISQMNQVEAARAIGRIEARLEAKAARTIPQTRAPEPISPVRGGATPSRDPARMNAAEFAKWRESGGTFSL